jgi:hypothetical protein
MQTDLHPSQLEPGDVLLCRGNTTGVSPAAYVRGEISIASSSPYTHAAIFLGGGEVVDARVAEGIRVRPLPALIAESDYVAAIRQPDVWSADRVEKLRSFARKLHEMGMKYNIDAFRAYVFKPTLDKKLAWESYQEAHRATIMDRIEAIFSGETVDPPPDPFRKYFCSELVVSVFELVGFLGRGAGEIYNAAYMAPGDLVRDCTFGFLVGYMAKEAPRPVPADDPLLHTPLVTSVPRWGL